MADYSLFHQLINDRDLNRFQCRVGETLDTSGNGITQNELTRFLRHIENSFNNKPLEPALWQWVVYKAENTPVGLVELSAVCSGAGQDVISPVAVMMGFSILKDYQGKGYATAAAKQLMEWAKSTGEVMEIQGWCHPQNTQSQKLMAKVGMSINTHAEERFRAFPMLGQPAAMQVWSVDLTQMQ